MEQVKQKRLEVFLVAVLVAFFVAMGALVMFSYSTAEASTNTFFDGRFEIVDRDSVDRLRMIVRDVDTGEWYFYERSSYGNVVFEHMPGHAGE